MRDGHEISHHSYTHAWITKLTPDQEREYDAAFQEMLRQPADLDVRKVHGLLAARAVEARRPGDVLAVVQLAHDGEGTVETGAPSVEGHAEGVGDVLDLAAEAAVVSEPISRKPPTLVTMPSEISRSLLIAASALAIRKRAGSTPPS